MVDDTIAPWDRLPYFNQPVETSYPIIISPQQIAMGNPNRVALILALSGSLGLNITVSYPIPIAFAQAISIAQPVVTVSTDAAAPSAGKGIILPITGEPIIIDWRKFGPLVTVPWYALSTVPTTAFVTAFEVTMNRWIGDNTAPNLIQDTDNGAFRGGVAGRTNRPGRAKLYGDSWSQREAISPYNLSDLINASLRKVGGAGGG